MSQHMRQRGSLLHQETQVLEQERNKLTFFFFFLSGAVTAESLNSAQGHLDEPELVQRRVIRMGLKSRWE